MIITDYFFYSNIDSLNLNVNDIYKISFDGETKYIGKPTIDTSGFLLSDGSNLNNIKKIVANTSISDNDGENIVNITIYDNVKMNASNKYESDLTKSVLVLKITPDITPEQASPAPQSLETSPEQSGISLQSLETFITSPKITISRYEKLNDSPEDFDYTLEQLPIVVTTVTELMKLTFDKYDIGYNNSDQLNRLIDRVTYTPEVRRTKTNYIPKADIKIHPGERYVFYLPNGDINSNQTSTYALKYNMNIGGNKETLIKFDVINFVNYVKNANGTYSDNANDITRMENLVIRCHDGFATFKRTIEDGSKMGVNVMDDGRVDITNMGTNSILIPQYVDTTLANTKIAKYNKINFEFNYFNNYHIMRNDFGYLKAGKSFTTPLASFYKNGSNYFMCNENIWYDTTDSTIKVHIDFNRMVDNYDGSPYFVPGIQQIYLKEQGDEYYKFIENNVCHLYYINGYYNADSHFIDDTINQEIKTICKGVDISLSSTNTILALSAGNRYKFKIKIVDQYGNIDVQKFMIMATTQGPLAMFDPPQPS